MPDIYLARQPIYDSSLNVYAYELLFRDNEQNRAGVIDGDEATSNVIVNTFMEIGLNNIVDDRLAFINLTRSFIVNAKQISLPRDRVVLELLEDIAPDEEVIAGMQRLSRQGYQIALDDFVLHETVRPLIELADIIKIDVMALSDQQIRNHVEELRRYPVKLLAEKVESWEMYDMCKALNFDFYQGYYFSLPKIIQKKSLPTNRLSILTLLGQLQDPDIATKDLEDIIAKDVALSYRMLNYVNSAALGLARKVDSIHEAIILVGLQNIRSWATLIAMSMVDDKPVELVNTAMIRGRMCERLAQILDQSNPKSFFTVGLFSALDALMDTSMDAILTQLPLAEHIADALVEHNGIHGQILTCVLDYERGEWNNMNHDLPHIPEIHKVYLDALMWASQMRAQMIQHN
ncbi:MAG: HDOD domain-containing protein [Gammaproteobacteria bacterium]